GAVDPEQSSVDRLLPRGRRSADELGPAFRQQALALPNSILEIKQPEAGPISRRAIVVPSQEKVAIRVGLEHLIPDTDSIEQGKLRESQIFSPRFLTATLINQPIVSGSELRYRPSVLGENCSGRLMEYLNASTAPV